MLVGGFASPQNRIAYLLAAVGILCLPAAGWYLAASLGWTDWPSGSTPLGLTLGIIAAGIIAFEMLLWPRKWYRGRRFGRARVWMRWHIWLGLVSLPLAVGHAGFRFGGPLTTAVLVLFLVVIASGVWGLALQQVLPSKLLHGFATETIEPEVDLVMTAHREQADELVTRVGGGPDDALTAFYLDVVRPYLQRGGRAGSPLRSAAWASELFADLAVRAPEAGAIVRRLEEHCAERRQYDQQVRIHRWLHNWLLIHLPLSVALVVLLAVHVWTALKYW